MFIRSGASSIPTPFLDLPRSLPRLLRLLKTLFTTVLPARRLLDGKFLEQGVKSQVSEGYSSQSPLPNPQSLN
ncbi:hypothetical protein H6G06_20740 [Anabaena sphaerica FACHB-251]|uniref:Uncharacterized protein n=1 Tax=Anabaena sphaerica FACHB-251 TaxID=2692883 RepID=A0A927A2J6_9NOST|nr:hypothetical protein [Anabaena sphaerica]MBD2295834.1 hypothetical protein [Anabaena sphaerica FACHB-251]